MQSRFPMWRDTEMAYIQILPEFGLVADPLVGLVTSAGESFSPVLEKIVCP